jgi:type I restriction enzyme M protein
MHWIAPSEKDAASETLEKRLWSAANQLWAIYGLKAQEYSGPILGIIFLRFDEVRFALQRAKLEQAAASSRRGSRVDEPAAYHAEGILYLAPNARFDFLLNLPEAQNIGAKVNDAMREIEKHNRSSPRPIPTPRTSSTSAAKPSARATTSAKRSHTRPSTPPPASPSRAATSLRISATLPCRASPRP